MNTRLHALPLVLLLLAVLTSFASPGAPEAFTFAVISDTHLQKVNGEYALYPDTGRTVSLIVKRLAPRFVVHCGDMINIKRKTEQDGAAIEKMWKTFLPGVRDPLTAAGIAFFPSAGNHDIWGSGREHYGATWKGWRNPGFTMLSGSYESWYAFSYGGSLFVVLDGSSADLGRAQESWLRELLRKYGGRHLRRFAFSHYGLAGGTRHPTAILKEPAGSILSEGKVDFVISGHLHEFFSKKGGVICAGSAGKGDPSRFLLFTVKGRDVTFRTLTPGEAAQ